MSWNRTTLGELIEIKHGFAFKSEFYADAGKYILLTPGNCHESGGLKLKGEREKYYVGEIPNEFLLGNGDLLVVMTDLVNTAPILGGSFIIPEDDRFLHNQRLGLVTITDVHKLDKKFLYYLLNTRSYRGQVRGSASGATVRHTSPERIRRCVVSIPRDKKEQEQIAHILSAYDDLIENNRRRIQLLEQAARLLYKEWFVHLRFPGHEHVKMIGGVPEGWEVCAIKELIDGLFDGPHATPPDADEGPIFLGIKNISDSGRLDLTNIRHISERDFPKWTKRVLPMAGDIVFSYEATLNLYAMIPKGFRGCLGRRLALIRPKLGGNYNAFLLLTFFAKSWRDIIEKHRRPGATVDRIPLEAFPDFPLFHPSKQTLLAFNEKVMPLLRQVELIQEQSSKLAKARDLLLPRLMNGEIPV